MPIQALKQTLPTFDLRQKQANNITFITFWSQFSVYAFNTILILFLTRPILNHGLGFSDAKAYAFIGVTQATGYLMPLLGGFMADQILGIRRAILFGSFMLALAYLFVMLSGYTVGAYGDYFFIAAYAFIPVTNSLIMGTASSLVSHIYSDDAVKAKSAMTYYYIAINAGALLATIIAPSLLDSRFGPLSVLTIAFIGKSIAALNFARRYSLYDNVTWGKDNAPLSFKGKYQLFTYLVLIYSLTLFAYSHIAIANIFISTGCVIGILWFLAKTMMLPEDKRRKQLIAVVLIIEAVVFFVIYNQTHSTLILFAKNNSNNMFLGFPVSPAHYQLLNPLLILLIGMQLPRLYKKTPNFTIPYQFAVGTLLAGLALIILALAAQIADQGIVNGNLIALTYVLITIAELFVSAIGLSMIGLYCDHKSIAFAMGVWYLACSLSNTISGQIASFVAIPEYVKTASESISYYYNYYLDLGMSAVGLGCVMWMFAYILQKKLVARGIQLS